MLPIHIHIDPETTAETTLKIDGAASPKQIVELVVFINPGETTFSVIKIVAEDVHPELVVAITTTSAPFGIKLQELNLLVEKYLLNYSDK